MSSKNVFAWIFSISLVAPVSGVVKGQDFPYKPVRIVTSGAGGASDIAARLVGQGISPALGQPVVIENRPAGVIVADTVAKAPPDGHTVLLYGSVLWLGPFMQDTPYDPVKDFSPVTLALTSPNILVVHPSLPTKSVKELIALAKAKPGALNFGTSGAGGSSHLAAELFKAMADIDIVRVNYKGGAAALNDLISGQVQLLFPAAATVTPHVKSGKMRALAVTGSRPFALFPELPTVASAALPGYESVGIFAVFAPAKTPAVAIDRLNQAIVRYLRSPEAKDRLAGLGVEVVASSPEQLAATMKSEMARMGKVIKDAGIRTQ